MKRVLSGRARRLFGAVQVSCLAWGFSALSACDSADDGAGSGGATQAAGTTSSAGAGAAGAGGSVDLEPFSFFVTSLAAMVRLSGVPEGFGGDLRYGQSDGLAGADKICTEIAESSQ